MKKYQFNLQALLRLKEIKENERKRELAVVNSRLLQAQDVIRRIEKEWSLLQLEELRRRKEGCSPDSMGRSVNYRLLLEENAIQQGLNIQRIMTEQESKRQALVKATQEKKALENIRQRRFEEWSKQYRREQANVVDDLCQIQYVRKTLMYQSD